jgi:SAM-dependent methyltransferase
MVTPTNAKLLLGGNEVSNNAELIAVYRKRIEKYGMSGQTMFYLDEAQHQTKVAQFAILLHELMQPQDHLLDIGCGYGSLVPLLPPCQYTGIDLVPEFVAYAQSRYNVLEFLVVDLADCHGVYDWCALVGVVNSVKNPEQLIKLAWNKCRKGMLVDFIDERKLTGDGTGLNRFHVGSCLTELLQLGAQSVTVYQTHSVWTVFVASKVGKWVSSRS